MGNTIRGCFPWNAPRLQQQLQSSSSALHFFLTSSSSSSSQAGESGGILESSTDRQHPQLSAYNILDKIGSGIHSTVHHVTHKQTGKNFACKSIRISIALPQPFENEITILQSLADHKNVVKLEEVLFDQPGYVHLIMELCEGGDLLDGVIRIGHGYSEKKAAGIFREIMKIISMCHFAGVIHRDLKPQNLMFSTMEEDSPLKAIDFGIATFFKPGRTFATSFGSIPYVAPEVLRSKHGQEVDIWSAGVILCVLLSGFPPFLQDNLSDTDDDNETSFEKIVNGDIDYNSAPWSSASDSAIHLLNKILKLDWKARISVRDILKHRWVREGGDASDKPMDTAVIRRMKMYRAWYKMGRVPLQVIVETLLEEEIMDLKEKLKFADHCNLGTISFKELVDSLNQWGKQLKWAPQFSELEVKELVEADGRINYDEFVANMMNNNWDIGGFRWPATHKKTIYQKGRSVIRMPLGCSFTLITILIRK